MHLKTLTNAQITNTTVSSRSMRMVHGIRKLPAFKLTLVQFHILSPTDVLDASSGIFLTHSLHFDYPNKIHFPSLVSLC